MPRQEDRIAYLEEIVLEFSSGKQLARISDVSLGGCYVDSISSVPVGEDVAFLFTRPGAENIRFSGKVAYLLEGFGFGIHFNDLSDDAKKLLLLLVEEKGS